MVVIKVKDPFLAKKEELHGKVTISSILWFASVLNSKSVETLHYSD